MVSTGTIKAYPASARQPLGFRTMYNSMHGEQIQLTPQPTRSPLDSTVASLAGTATGCSPAKPTAGNRAAYPSNAGGAIASSHIATAVSPATINSRPAFASTAVGAPASCLADTAVSVPIYTQAGIASGVATGCYLATAVAVCTMHNRLCHCCPHVL